MTTTREGSPHHDDHKGGKPPLRGSPGMGAIDVTVSILDRVKGKPALVFSPNALPPSASLFVCG